jgi:hypothetical protein
MRRTVTRILGTGAIACALVLVLPTAAGAAPRRSAPAVFDTVDVSGSTSNGFFQNIDIHAQASPDGTNVSGTVLFDLGVPVFPVGGPITCLRVTGPDLGSGTATSPTQAVINTQTTNFGIVTIELTDNGGGGRDVMRAIPIARAPDDCSPLTSPIYPTGVLTTGRAVIFDAPLLPTSKDLCKNGGWARFGFRNQGQCIAFVNHT